MIIPIYKLPDNKKEIIVNDTLNKIYQDDIFCSNDEYEHDNVPDYDLFNNHVFNIFKEVETIKYAYAIVSSKWVVAKYRYPTLENYLKWRNTHFTKNYLYKTCEDINDEGTFDLNKTRRNLNDNGSSFSPKNKLTHFHIMKNEVPSNQIKNNKLT